MGFLVASVDLILAGRAYEGAARIEVMDALGLAAYVAWLMMILQGAVGTGVMALVSRAAGARDQDVATRAMGQGLLVGFLTGLGAGLLIRSLLGRIESKFGRVQIVSTCRPGARIAGTGRPSRHASGNAIDFRAPGRKGEVVRWLIANHKSGGVMTYNGMDHIHVDIGPHFVSLNH